ncbi:MAG: hypothetical protein CMK71_10335 [Pseudomonadaceae bacterium]|nr:hypothetical protein [Pseudomonadaceae bacterium]
MASRNKRNNRRRPRVNQSALLFTPLIWSLSCGVNADTFNYGEVSGRVNGSITVGGIWNTSEPDSSLIFQGNANAIGYNGRFGTTRTSDDGRLNFHKKGELVSSPITLLAETELKWRDYGVFIRGKAWYDYTLNNKNVPFGHSSNGYQADSTLNDSHFDDLAKFQGLSLLDAYVYGNFALGDQPLQLRAGNQVVNWGEGLFFQNGINAVNPIDASALRRPGSQLKEALLPVPIFYGNLGLTDTVSMEAFYQLSWRKTVLDGCGTYFAANDYITDGCYGVPRAGANDPETYAANQYIRRAKDNEPSDDGQFGVAVHYFLDSIGTELGAYAMNIHSRTPFASTVADFRSSGAGWQNPTTAAIDAANGQYYADFPEDIRIFGLSFSSTVWGTSVFGEASYRPNQPVQLATADLIQAFATDPAGPMFGLGIPLALGDEALAAAPGSKFNGYDRLKVTQLSVGFLKSIPHVLGADSLSLVGEAAAKYMNDLPSLDDRRYNKSDQYGTNMANDSVLGCKFGATVERYKKYACSSDGFTTKFSWGYRLRAQLSYPSLFAGVNVSPYLAFGHDVQGWSYDSNIVEDRLLGTVGVKADYLQKYSAELSWSGSGNTPYAATDRDFVALSLSMGF